MSIKVEEFVAKEDGTQTLLGKTGNWEVVSRIASGNFTNSQKKAIFEKARRGGIPTRIMYNSKSFERFAYNDQRQFLVVMSADVYVSSYRTLSQAGSRIEALEGSNRSLHREVAPHRELASDIADSKDIARNALKRLGSKGGFVYRCRKCKLYFASRYSKSQIRHCRYCSSSDFLRVSLR